MAVSLVQTAPKATISGGQTQDITFSSTPTTGNLIVVEISGWKDGGISYPSSVTDNKGNTYTRAIDQSSAANGYCNASIFYAYNITASGTFTISIDMGTPSCYVEISASEFSGFGASDPLDKTAVDSGGTSGDAATTSTATLSQADELVIATVSLSADNTNVALTTPSGYTQLAVNQNSNATIGLEASYKIVSATTAVSAAWTHDNTNQSGWGAVLATFKAAAATTPLSPPFAMDAFVHMMVR